MKILHVFDFLSPSGGGVVSVTSHLAQAQAKRGHEVVIYTSDYMLDRQYIESLRGVRVKVFHCLSSAGGFFVMPAMVGEVRKKLKSYDIVHLHSARSFQNMAIHHYALIYRVPYVLEAHGSFSRSPGQAAGVKAALKRLYDLFFGYRLFNDAASLITQNKFGGKEYEAYGTEREKISLIPLSFPIGNFADLPPRGGFRTRYGIGDRKLVLFLGRLHHIKGIDFLIEAFAELCRSRDDVMLALVGPDDGVRGKLERQVSRLQLDKHVVFTGFLGGDDKLSALVDADLFVQPSRYEMAAWAPVEAVLCGTPVIVTRGTGAAEDISRMKGGYLVDYGDKEQMVTTIEAILDDPAEARDKASHAAKYVRENLQLSQKVDDYERLYKQCIASPSRRKR